MPLGGFIGGQISGAVTFNSIKAIFLAEHWRKRCCPGDSKPGAITISNDDFQQSRETPLLLQKPIKPGFVEFFLESPERRLSQTTLVMVTPLPFFRRKWRFCGEERKAIQKFRSSVFDSGGTPAS